MSHAGTARCGLVLSLAFQAGCLGEPIFQGGVAAGLLRSSRTDAGRGGGWIATVSLAGMELAWDAPAPRRGTVDVVTPQFEISNVSYDEDGRTGWRVSAGVCLEERAGGGPAGEVYHLSWSAHWDDDGAWGTGPRAGFGYGAYGAGWEVRALTTACLWLGADEAGGFAAGTDADVRLAAGVRF